MIREFINLICLFEKREEEVTNMQLEKLVKESGEFDHILKQILFHLNY